MTPEKRKFIKVMKARRRRAAYLKGGRVRISPINVDLSKFIKSVQKPVQRKESFFKRLKNKLF